MNSAEAFDDAGHLDALLDALQGGGDGGAGHDPRGQGQVFTPDRLATALCRAVLGARAAATPVVLDPAAGDGSFLAAAAAVAPGAILVGVERDPALAAAARRRVPGATVHRAEALFDAPALPRADAVVGNPPYVRSIRLRAADPALWARVRGAFAATSFGEWDLYGAFLERSLDWVAPGGRVGLIVPSRWLTARWAAPLRAHLAGRGAVRALVELGADQVFARATTYASIAILAPGPARGPAVLVRRRGAGWERSVLDTRARGDAPWLGAAPPRGTSRRLTLGDVARIAKGTGTNADRVFVLPGAIADGAWVRSGDVVVEAAATRPCLRGRDVGGPVTARCVVPYDGAALIPWDELVVRWPRAAAYLAAHRAVLEARERGRFTGARFHAFGRPQNLAFHLDPAPKVVIPDVARAPRSTLDATGALVLDSAYALRPRPGAPPPWDRIEHLRAFLASPEAAAWIERASVPLRGDYRRWKTAFLAPMPLPCSGTVRP